MPASRPNLSSNDHDLLIRVDENVRGMSGRLADYEKSNTAAIQELRTGKVDLKDFEEYKRGIDQRFSDADHRGSESFNSYKNAVDGRLDKIDEATADISKEQANHTKKLYIGIGIVIAIQIIALPLLFIYLQHH